MVVLRLACLAKCCTSSSPSPAMSARVIAVCLVECAVKRSELSPIAMKCPLTMRDIERVVSLPPERLLSARKSGASCGLFWASRCEVLPEESLNLSRNLHSGLLLLAFALYQDNAMSGGDSQIHDRQPRDLDCAKAAGDHESEHGLVS